MEVGIAGLQKVAPTSHHSMKTTGMLIPPIMMVQQCMKLRLGQVLQAGKL